MADYKPQLADLDQASVKMPDPSPSQPECPPLSIDEWSFNLAPPGLPTTQPESPPQPALDVVARIRSARDQRPGETYQQYFIRHQQRNEARMKTETAQDKAVRANQERSAAGRQYPGRKGPAVYYWESDSNGFRVRTLQTRAEAQKLWGLYSGAGKIFDSFANEWDCCMLFGDDDSDMDTDDDGNFLSIPKPPPPQEDSSLPPHEEPTPNLPLPHKSTSSLSHENPTPNPPPMQEDSSLPPHKELTTNLPPPHEESSASNLSLVTSLEEKAKSQETPMDIDVDSLPCPPQSSASSYHSHRPALSRGDDSSMQDMGDHCPYRDSRDDSPRRYHSWEHCSYRDSRDDSPRQYHCNHSWDRRPYRDSRSDRPSRSHHSQDPLRSMHYHNRYSEDDRSRHDNPRHYYNSGFRSMRRHSRSHSPESYQCSSSGRVDSDPQEESDDDLLTLSRGVVLSVHPPDPMILFGIQTDSLEDHVYYRFGFCLDENTYIDVPSSTSSATFRDWLEVRRAIGCHEVDGPLSCQRPIQHFLECLLSKDPLCDVPAHFWDLNASNIAPLNLVAGFIHIEPKEFLDGMTRYLIRPVGLHLSRDSSWVLAVDAMTALECVRCRLGPHTIDIADFLINRGIPFSTLQRMMSTPGPHTPPWPISNLPGTRPMKYQFDLADFSVYQMVCGSILRSNPFCRAALCMGGIVAHLA